MKVESPNDGICNYQFLYSTIMQLSIFIQYNNGNGVIHLKRAPHFQRQTLKRHNVYKQNAHFWGGQLIFKITQRCKCLGPLTLSTQTGHKGMFAAPPKGLLSQTLGCSRYTLLSSLEGLSTHQLPQRYLQMPRPESVQVDSTPSHLPRPRAQCLGPGLR